MSSSNILSAIPLPPVLGMSPLKEDRSMDAEKGYYALQQITATADRNAYIRELRKVPSSVPYGVSPHLKKT